MRTESRCAPISFASGRSARFALRSHSATSSAASAWVASPERPTDAPAHSSLSYRRGMSEGSSPIKRPATSFAWAYWAGPPARLE